MPTLQISNKNVNADELLRTRTIPELRALLTTLAADAASKQTELQQMVGYHYLSFLVVCCDYILT